MLTYQGFRALCWDCLRSCDARGTSLKSFVEVQLRLARNRTPYELLPRHVWRQNFACARRWSDPEVHQNAVNVMPGSKLPTRLERFECGARGTSGAASTAAATSFDAIFVGRRRATVIDWRASFDLEKHGERHFSTLCRAKRHFLTLSEAEGGGNS